MAFAVWTVGLAAFAQTVGPWDTDVRNDTIAWLLTVGMGLLFSANEVTEDEFLRDIFRRAVAVTVFVGTFMNLSVLSLPAELVLVPVVTSSVMIVALNEARGEYPPARSLANGILVLIGACGGLYVAIQLTGDLDAAHTVRALALPVWLTVGSLPFVYVVGLLAEYEKAFLRSKRAPG